MFSAGWRRQFPFPAKSFRSGVQVRAVMCVYSTIGMALSLRLGIASLYFHLKEHDQAKDWCAKIQQIDPANAAQCWGARWTSIIIFEREQLNPLLSGEKCV